MVYFVATIAMVITFIASMFTILLIGWALVYGDDGLTTTAIIIEFVIAGGLALLVFFVVCNVFKSARARRMPD